MRKCLRCQKIIEGTPHYGLHDECFKSWFNVGSCEEFTSLIFKQSASDPDEANDQNSSFFHGQYKKYSANLAGGSYILKVRQSSAPELPEVEFLCNQIAETLRIPVAKYYLIELAGDRAFVTKNFIDRTQHQNLTHIYEYFPKEHRRDCESLIRVIDEQAKSFGDIETFIMTCLYDSLIGNHDRHGRNLGLIVASPNPRLAPVYDNPSVVGIHSGAFLKMDHGFSGRIPTRDDDHPSITDYVQEFRRLGYEEQIDQFKSYVKLARIEALVARSYCTDPMKEALLKLIKKQWDVLRHA